MTTMHFGYSRETEHGLRAILGDNFWSSELSVTISRPWADMPTDYGAIESQPVGRMAVVIEGEADKIQPYLEAIAKVRESQA